MNHWNSAEWSGWSLRVEAYGPGPQGLAGVAYFVLIFLAICGPAILVTLGPFLFFVIHPLAKAFEAGLRAARDPAVRVVPGGSMAMFRRTVWMSCRRRFGICLALLIGVWLCARGFFWDSQAKYLIAYIVFCLGTTLPTILLAVMIELGPRFKSAWALSFTALALALLVSGVVIAVGLLPAYLLNVLGVEAEWILLPIMLVSFTLLGLFVLLLSIRRARALGDKWFRIEESGKS